MKVSDKSRVLTALTELRRVVNKKPIDYDFSYERDTLERLVDELKENMPAPPPSFEPREEEEEEEETMFPFRKQKEPRKEEPKKQIIVRLKRPEQGLTDDEKRELKLEMDELLRINPIGEEKTKQEIREELSQKIMAELKREYPQNFSAYKDQLAETTNPSPKRVKFIFYLSKKAKFLENISTPQKTENEILLELKQFKVTAKQKATSRSTFQRQGYKRKELGFCITCGEKALSKCGACLSVAYCSPSCQKDDWNLVHRYECLKVK